MKAKREFKVSLYCGEGNNVHLTGTYSGQTPFDAFNAFCFEHKCIGYPLRQERPEEDGGLLWSVWSAGCSISGQRIYVREVIGSC